MTQQNNQQWKNVVSKIRSFLQRPYGIAAVLAVVFAICVAVGLHMSKAVLGEKGSAEQDDSQVEETDENYNGGEEIDTSKFQGTVLPKTDDAGEEYINETLFVGDSNTVRYMSYGFASLDNAIGVISMSATQINSLPCVNFKGNGGMVTINKALPLMQPKRVIFGFGTNDLTGGTKSYISSYEKAIQKCYEAYPYFDVIVTAIPPVDKYRDYPAITMQNIDKFNAALVDMCEKNGWKFLNTSEVLKDKTTGFAKKDYTVYDGLHLSKEGVTALFEYIRTHAYETEDRRPKPLKEVPKRGETPPDLITKDPLKPDGPRPTATATATASPETIPVHFTSGEGGKIQGELEQHVAIAGTCAGVEAVPDEGYIFKEWSCTIGRLDPGNPKLQFTVPGNATEAITVTATFKKVEATAVPTVKPAEPTAAPKPVEPDPPISTPIVTQAPTQEPVKTPEPVETPKPVETPEPVETPKPVDPPAPVTPDVPEPVEPEVPDPAPVPPAPETSEPAQDESATETQVPAQEESTEVAFEA